MQTLYLAGNVGSVIWLNLGVLAAMAAALLARNAAGDPQADFPEVGPCAPLSFASWR